MMLTGAFPTTEEILDFLDIASRGPRVSAIAISSLDGRGAVEGTSGALGNATDAAIFNSLRAHADAVVVGASTIRSEAYGAIEVPAATASRRSVRGQKPFVPIVTVSRSLDFALDSPLVHDAARYELESDSFSNTIVYTTEPSQGASGPITFQRWCNRREALEERGVEIRVRERLLLTHLVAELQANGFAHVVCEGGPSVYAQAFEQQLVDEVFLTIAPYFVGGGPHTFGQSDDESPQLLQAFTLRDQLMCDSHLFLRYDRALPH